MKNIIVELIGVSRNTERFHEFCEIFSIYSGYFLNALFYSPCISSDKSDIRVLIPGELASKLC